MCDAKPNSTMTVKTDSRRATGGKRELIGYGTAGNWDRSAGDPVYDYSGTVEKDPNVTDNSKREEYGLAPKKGPGLDLTDKALRDARMNEALRLRGRRGRKSSFLESDMDWADQRYSGKSSSPSNPFTQTTKDGVGGSWDL